MQKIIFLFGRKPPQTHAEFAEHYLEHHAPLGLKVAVQMDGYTVNLVPDEASGEFDLDAVTETWTPSVEAFMDPQRAFANEADMTELMTDDASFIANARPYVVSEELVVGEWPSGAARTRTPGVKRMSLNPTDATLPPTDGCTRVVRNRVLQSFLPDAPEAAMILLEWAESADTLAPLDVLNWLVEENVQRQPTR